MDDYVAEPSVTLVPVGVSLFRPGHRMPGEENPNQDLPVIRDPDLVEVCLSCYLAWTWKSVFCGVAYNTIAHFDIARQVTSGQVRLACYCCCCCC